jgi:hypothetical protein
VHAGEARKQVCRASEIVAIVKRKVYVYITGKMQPSDEPDSIRHTVYDPANFLQNLLFNQRAAQTKAKAR